MMVFSNSVILPALEINNGSAEGNVLYSPLATSTSYQTLRWRVALFPNGTKQSKGHIGVYVHILGHANHSLSTITTADSTGSSSLDDIGKREPGVKRRKDVKGLRPMESPKPEHWQRSLRSGRPYNVKKKENITMRQVRGFGTRMHQNVCVQYSIELLNEEGTAGKY